MHRPCERIWWPTIIGLGLVVVAFMVLSLLVTATGTARFAVSMGYDASVGYAVGAVFDVAKGMLLVGVVALWGRGALGVSAAFAIGWICLVTFSWLATHATVSTAITSIERTGTWKMEVRGNAKAELTSIEQQLAVLSRPTPPRPVKTVAEALTSTNVPSGVWKNSHECAAIQDGAYFAKPCAETVRLRRELAAAQDHERLSARAAELRQSLAVAPIVSTSDPLPAAFDATLGRLVPVGGTEGVALLLTMVVEIVSCFGLAALSVLCGPASHQRLPASPCQGSLSNAHVRDVPGASLRGTLPTLPKAKPGTLPEPSLEAAASERADTRGHRSNNPPSNVVAMLPPSSLRKLAKGASPTLQGKDGSGLAVVGSHVPAFVQDRLRHAHGASIAAGDLRATYEDWCAGHGHAALSQPKLATELKALGYTKWKCSGLMRYRDLQLVA
jgi:hypothetical protein